MNLYICKGKFYYGGGKKKSVKKFYDCVNYFDILWFCEFLGEDGEEVFVECFGDLEEEVGVEAFALEDVIYVGAFATDFAGKP